MEPYGETSDIFYLGAQTEWLPAEHFTDINNWDDSLKPSALYYIKQTEAWIVSEEDCTEEYELSRKVSCMNTNSDNRKQNETASSAIKNLMCVDKQKQFECRQCG